MNIKPDRQRLLVVDDEQIICQIVQGFLTNDGWEVDAAPTLDAADGLMELEYYPVVVLDVHLTGSSSEFLKKWKRQRATTQFVMFTGDPSVSSVRDALQNGAYDYLTKPCRREELSRVVGHALERCRLLHEQGRLQAENEVYRRKLEDLVERRTSQLRASELRYRAIFDRAVDAILLVDIETGLISDHNIAARHLAGVKNGDLLGQSVRDYVGDQLDVALQDARRPGHGEWRYEHVHFHSSPGFNRTVQLSLGKVELGDGTYLQMVAHDVTDQVALQDQQALLETELFNEQRLSAIGQLASGIAHNINTPLMGIYGAAQLIKLKHPQVEDADALLSQVERINDIVRNLVWKSRHEQEQGVQAIDLNQLIREEMRFLEADLEFKHGMEKCLNLSDNVPAIMGRYGDFSQTLLNLVRNAFDSMQDQEVRRLSVSTEVRDGELRLSVADTGCGIPADVREQIFKPFFTTRPGDRPFYGAAGKGLGLSAVRKLMTPYEARIDIEDVKGGGTLIAVCLPLAKNGAAAQRLSNGMER